MSEYVEKTSNNIFWCIYKRKILYTIKNLNKCLCSETYLLTVLYLALFVSTYTLVYRGLNSKASLLYITEFSPSVAILFVAVRTRLNLQEKYTKCFNLTVS